MRLFEAFEILFYYLLITYGILVLVLFVALLLFACYIIFRETLYTSRIYSQKEMEIRDTDNWSDK